MPAPRGRIGGKRGYTAALLLAVLPVLALGACVLAVRGRVAGWREALLGGAVAWGVALVAITELLSLAHLLTAPGLVVGWLVALGLAGVAGLAGAPTALSVASAPARSWRSLVDGPLGAASRHRRVDWRQVALYTPLGLLLLVLGAIAAMSPPNTWDAMTYHMARLIHWSQDASLAPYPTHILRQLALQPGAEFVLLHLQLLSGGDHLASLVQWTSMLGALVGVSLIATDLGAGRVGTHCAVVFAAALPIGILESTSTQNDYVVAFWLICVLVFALRLLRAARWPSVAAFGASAGLAVLTKAPAYLVVVPVGIWLVVALARRSGWRGVARLAAAAAIALVLNLGFYARNLTVFGSPFGPLDEGAPSLRYLNDGFTPPLLLSNVLRDVAINFNATPLTAINVRARNFVLLVHAWLGVDIADPRTTWGGEVFAEQPIGLAFDEDFASNPAHLLLLVATLAVVWPMRRRVPAEVGPYALVLAGAFTLFTVVLRWQPWNTRLELPLFVLGAPLVGTLLNRISSRLALLVAAVLVGSMLPWVVYNQARPLVGPRSILSTTLTRDERYFANRPGLRPGYLDAVGSLAQRGCARVGFVSNGDGWEYPLWPLLRATAAPGATIEIEHVGVDNVSAALALPALTRSAPCAILALGPPASLPSMAIQGQTFATAWAALDPSAPLEQVAVLTPDGR